MTRALLASLLVSLLAGCSCTSATAPTGDVGPPRDAGGTDTPSTLDAPALDAEALDAPALDAAEDDGGEIDGGAPVDAPPLLDAPTFRDVPPTGRTRALYYMQGTQIFRAELDGTLPTLVVDTGETWVHDVEGDPASGRLFWAETFVGRIRSSRYDGTDVRLVVDTPDPMTDIAIDPAGDGLFWILQSLFGMPGLYRSSLAGTGTVELGAFAHPSALALDPNAGRVYLGDSESPRLVRAALDGTAPTTANVGSGNASVIDVELDPAGGYVYWLTLDVLVGRFNQIWRAPVDLDAATFSVGTPEPLVMGTPLVSGLPLEPQPTEVAIDVEGRSLYWAIETDSNVHEIWRGALDGTGATRVLVVTGTQTELALSVIERP